MTPFDDPHKLLNAIEDWYDQNGSSADIPGPIEPSEENSENGVREEAHSEFAEAFNSNSNHTVSYGGDEIYEVRGHVLPLLAGVKLGFSANTLKKIISHHEISVDDIINLSFPHWGRRENVVLTHQNGAPCTQFDFACTILQAMNLLPERQMQMANAVSNDPVITLALIHADNESAWPSTKIKERAAEAQSTTAKAFRRNPLPSQDFASIAIQLKDYTSLPNHNPMEFIHRIGMLLPDTAKRSTAQYAIWEALAVESKNGNKCCQNILSFCANHKSPKVQERVRQALVSLGSYEHMDDPIATHTHLRNIFNNNTYSDVFNKVVPRINLVPFEPESFADTFFYDPNYGEFMGRKESVLSVIAKEIISQPVEDLGYNQLYVFAKLKWLELPAQRIEGFSPEALVNHVLDGVTNYTAKYPLPVCDKARMDSEVKEALSDLIQILQMTHKFDYTSFDKRTTQEKSLLIESGFPAKELKFRNNVASLFGATLG